MFIDKVNILVKAGDGGDGSRSMRTEKFVPNGGPDGGDGGRGGDIVFVATESENSLNMFRFEKQFRADNGENGGKKHCYGKSGADKVLNVPVGTVVKDAESGKVIADLFSNGQREVVLKGGRGGRGNCHFANSRRQAPEFAELGEKAVERQVTLELKTIADVGLVGFPNVGKSTLLSVVSEAKPKIANYHFTTLSPNLGVVNYYDKSFVMADIPGLIEGASGGAGLGHSFLRHIERTRMLVHIVDISGSENRDPLNDFELINKELIAYDESLKDVPMLVALNKMDMPDSLENQKRFVKKYGKKFKIVSMTAIIHEGVNELLQKIIELLQTLPPVSPLRFEPFEFEEADKTSFVVSKLSEGVYKVTGGLVTELSRKVSLNNPDSFRYFQRVMEDKGVVKQLRGDGAKDGDTVIVGEIEFELID